MKGALTWSIALSLFLLMHPGFAQDVAADHEAEIYRSPLVVENPPFDMSKTGVEADMMKTQAQMAAAMARNLILPNRVKSKLLAISLSLDPKNKIGLETSRLLGHGVRPNPIRFENEVDWSNVAGGFVQAGYHVYEKSEGNPDAKILAGMMLDCAREMFPDNSDLVYTHNIFLQSNDPVPWETILGEGIKPDGTKVAAMGAAGEKAGLESQLKTKEASLKVLLPWQAPETIRAIVSPATKGSGLIGTNPSLISFRDTVAHLQPFLQTRYRDTFRNASFVLNLSPTFDQRHRDTLDLASILAIESMMLGDPIDPRFAVAGEFDFSTMKVSPVVSAMLRVQEAETAGLRYVAIPQGNEQAAMDLAVLGDWKVLCKVQIFGMTDLEPLWGLARTKRPGRYQASIDDFGKMQTALQKRSLTELSRDPRAHALLKHVLERTPNHLSAGAILAGFEKRVPATLSVDGSMQLVLQEVFELSQLTNANDHGPKPGVGAAPFASLAAKRERWANKVHPEVEAAVAEVAQFTSLCQKTAEADGASSNAIRQESFGRLMEFVKIWESGRNG